MIWLRSPNSPLSRVDSPLIIRLFPFLSPCVSYSLRSFSFSSYLRLSFPFFFCFFVRSFVRPFFSFLFYYSVLFDIVAHRALFRYFDSHRSKPFVLFPLFRFDRFLHVLLIILNRRARDLAPLITGSL